MWRAVLSGLVMLVMLVGCALQPVASGDGAGDAAGSPIAVVQTWRDLLDQPAIALGEGKGTARLGISATQSPCGSGVVVCCLTEGSAGPRDYDGRELGPLVVDVRREDECYKDREIACGQSMLEREELAASIALYRRSIPIGRSGRFRVRVFRPEDESGPEKLVGEAMVTGVETPYHPWLTFMRGKEVDELSSAGGDYDAVDHVAIRGEHSAIPRLDGLTPVIHSSEGPAGKIRRSSDGRLPGLVPREAGGLQVTVRGTDLLIESREEIIVARADWHFLVRWWINGKPYRPTTTLKQFSDANGVVIKGKRLLLRLDFDPKALGAKPGDKVELQLLYCQGGWEFVMPDIVQMMHAVDLHEAGPEMLLSQRVRLR